ncbi:putative enzyme related to lactoylglutathione lyase [Actinoplanes tereljensis]|uniref:Glyoxalase n=1 Tax=Paractinoplanes tereljensis TaxID=571912 RepID=A0A919NLK0_9ACTN|nr:VOC family protein [Actinoplanes tereljensis]GIF21016.1 glyoxalase [Actinoplanes tereljensis]
MSATNQVDWFQIGTDQPAVAERFYGDVFGWSFGNDDDSPGYRLVSTDGTGRPGGGLADTSGEGPGQHAVFFVRVADTAETCRQAEAAGGKILVAPRDGGGGLVFAHVLDPAGNRVGVYTPADH